MTLAAETVADFGTGASTTAHAIHHIRPRLERLGALTTAAARALPNGALVHFSAPRAPRSLPGPIVITR